MTALWTSLDAVAATGGKTTRDWNASGVSIDTRSLNQGDLFVALSDVRDGHDFVATALENGAAAALVSRIPDNVPADAPLLIVPNVLTALEALGIAGRKRTKAKVIGVTGSVGKTSTKEMLRTIFGRQGRVHAAESSFNNQWGVPLTLARMPVDTEYAVIEIGMNHPGEIEPLAKMTRPDIALITNVAAVHLEAFKGVEEIAHEKADIFNGLTRNGIAVINADLPVTDLIRQSASNASSITLFGQSEHADYRLDDVQIGDSATVIKASLRGNAFLFKVGVPGRHYAMNALGALAVAELAGVDRAIAALDLAQWLPPSGRGVREPILLDPANEALTFDLLDDAFNANPMSTAAAIEVLAATNPRNDVGQRSKGRRIAVLGDMLELGPAQVQLHKDIVEYPGFEKIVQMVL